MKKILLTGLLLTALALAFAQKPRVVAFYNLENLFDTINDPEKLDDEFLPEGAKKWNTAKYTKKLANLDRVLFDIAVDAGKEFPSVIGVSEVENRSVLEDLISQQKLSHGNYRIVHYESPDRRGIDCAFLYRPDVFKLEGSRAIPFYMAEFPSMKTRDFVTMWGTIEGDPFFFVVSHWPSRLGGKEASAPKRARAAQMCRDMADSLHRIDPNIKFVVMGDFNDDATDDSVVKVLGAKEKIKDLGKDDMFNPFISPMKAGYGTLAYGDSWNLFDNIVMSENLATGSTGTMRVTKKPNSKFYGNIFCASYMFQQEGKFKGYPYRTFSGSNFLGGYSDHFPVYILIESKTK